MLTLERLRAIANERPGCVDTVSWGNPSMKVNGKILFYWNTALGAPVFKVSFEERDFLLEVDPETFFITDHHKPWPLILAHPDKINADWVRMNLTRLWDAQASRAQKKLWAEMGAATESVDHCAID